ncbi:MAG: glycosyltransferase family 32 protein [Lactobacillus sp.]
MIPKKIHYVWVGQQPKSRLIQSCLQTWRRRLPDYEIIEWNEDNFDMHENAYIEQAYRAKKWAFVSDYIRARVLFEQGGIYLDTDVRVLARLDSLLANQAFIGFENATYLSAAIIGAEAGNSFIKAILDSYQHLDFRFDPADPMVGVNSLSVTEIAQRSGLIAGNHEQILVNGLHVYPDGILCNPSHQSKTIHLFAGTWLDRQPLRHQLVIWLKQRLNTPQAAGWYQKLVRHD